MSLLNILTILLLIAACILPFIIINMRRKKSEQKFLQVLLSHASESNNTISQYDLSNQQAIGIADISNTLFFLKRRNNHDVIKQIELAQIERCYINKTSRSSIDGNYSATERLELRFTRADKNSSEEVFELYNLEHDSLSMAGQLELAEKWHSIVSSRLPRKAGKA